MTDTKNLTQLGAHVETPQSPEAAVLETVPFARGDGPPAIVRFTCPEFTSLCPVTGQPDFAHIVIDYAPDALLGGIEVAEAVHDLVSQPWRLP